jgi:hypothetical protein
VQQRRGDAAKIRAILEIIRSEAREFEAQGLHRIDADSWIQRADTIERRVRLAEVLDERNRKKTLGRLRTEADALVADLIDATAIVPSTPAPQPPEDEPHAP